MNEIKGQMTIEECIAAAESEQRTAANREQEQEGLSNGTAMVTLSIYGVASLIASVVRYGFAETLEDLAAETTDGLYGEHLRHAVETHASRVAAVRLAAQL